MQKHIITILTLPAMAFSIAACTDNATHLSPGKYESTEKITDSSGTTVTKHRSTKVMEDEYGNKKATVESETTKDPAGLFNETTSSKTKRVYEEEGY